MDGVFATRAGWHEGTEVTEVWFDPRRLPFEGLLRQAQRHDCASAVWTTSDPQRTKARLVLGELAKPLVGEPKPDKEPKYYLLQEHWRHVPMTPMQAMRCNAVAAPGKPTKGGADFAPGVLSPAQRALFAEVERHPGDWPVVVDVPLREAWEQVEAARARRARK